MPVIRLEEATKRYRWEGRVRAAVDKASMTIEQGEFVFFVGSSGAGKSTLLKLITGELVPEQGTVYLDNMNLAWVPAWRKPKLRRTFGSVWQDARLMRKRTIFENLAMVAQAGNVHKDQIRARVSKALGVVGMPGVEECYPVELSQGECRRVELARALINSPDILVLDELTGNLDEDSSWDIFQLLMEINRMGTTVLMATHASRMVNIVHRRVVTMVDGRIFGDVKKGKYGDII